MRELKQGSTPAVMLLMVSSTDHITGVAGATLALTLSKAGGAFAEVAPAVTERGNGWYSVALTAAHTDTLGDLILRATALDCDPGERVFNVVARVEVETYDAVLNLDGDVIDLAGAVTNVGGDLTLLAAAVGDLGIAVAALPAAVWNVAVAGAHTARHVMRGLLAFIGGRRHGGAAAAGPRTFERVDAAGRTAISLPVTDAYGNTSGAGTLDLGD